MNFIYLFVFSVVAFSEDSFCASSAELHGEPADRGEFEVALSVPLLAEYDDVCHRPNSGIPIPAWAVDDLINLIAQISRQQTIHYLWRGILPDPKDDMVLEVAVAESTQGFEIEAFSSSDRCGKILSPLRSSLT